MEWITELQQAVGGPVIALAREYFAVLAVVGMVSVWWALGLLGRSRGDGVTVGVWFGGDGSDSDADGGEGGDGGGGDGGGGD
jgi:hypothetical protein